jgi:hypothetical protein
MNALSCVSQVNRVVDLQAWCAANELPKDLQRDLGGLVSKQLYTLGIMEDGHGFVFASKETLLNLKVAVEALGNELSIGTDGTYKLVYSGWVLLILGTHALHYQVQPLGAPCLPLVPPCLILTSHYASTIPRSHYQNTTIPRSHYHNTKTPRSSLHPQYLGLTTRIPQYLGLTTIIPRYLGLLCIHNT